MRSLRPGTCRWRPFCLVGLVGSLPFALASRPFVRFDKGAAALLAVLAASAGVLGAVAWKQLAWSVIEVFPSVRRSVHAHHALALSVAVLAWVALATRTRGGALGAQDHVQVVLPIW